MDLEHLIDLSFKFGPLYIDTLCFGYLFAIDQKSTRQVMPIYSVTSTLLCAVIWVLKFGVRLILNVEVDLFRPIWHLLFEYLEVTIR